MMPVDLQKPLLLFSLFFFFSILILILARKFYTTYPPLHEGINGESN